MKQVFTPLLAIVSILFLNSCNRQSKTPDGWTDIIPVKALVVDDSSSPTVRNYVGDITSGREVSLSFPLGGTLTDVPVQNGQHVKAGQTLAEVDATTASSMHATAVATLRQAEDTYRRLQTVHNEGGISDVRWTQMETDLEKARQSELSTRKQVEDCTIRSPFSGIVSCSDRHIGQDLKPGEPFCRLIDMQRLRVSFSVPEQEVSQINTGSIARATIPALGDRKFTLRICDKGVTANPMGHTYRIYADIIDGDQTALLPDMVAKVEARLGDVGGIVVPSNCVQPMPGGIILWKISNGVAEQCRVTVSDFVKDGVVIADGIQSGDTIVVEGYHKLYTGAKVDIVDYSK